MSTTTESAAATRDTPGASPGEIKRGEPIYTARNVRKTYVMGSRKLSVVDDVSIDVNKGEVLAIVGRSGAGKSTLLHLLGLLDRPDAGELRFEHRDLSRVSAREACRIRCRRFGFIFQFYHLLPEFDALRNVMMPAMVSHGLFSWWGQRKAARARATELLERVGLGQRLDHKPSQLSGGERQRVAVARALMNQPAVVFCDEPTGNLDRETATSVEQLLIELSRTLDQAFVIVTHDDALGAKADRLLHMLDGKLGDGPLQT